MSRLRMSGRDGAGTGMRGLYTVHRWTAMMVGAFILMWLVSGIIMILPGPPRQPSLAPLDYRQVTISPAEAVAHLGQALGSAPRVDSVSLRRIADTAVYEIAVQGGSLHLIDGRAGRLLAINPELAERLARDEFESRAAVRRIDLLTRHGFGYPIGPLPVYRIVFDDKWATTSFVSVRDGTVRRINRWRGLLRAMGSLHSFEPIGLITRQEGIRKGLLVLVALLGIGAAGTGYYLGLARRRR